MHLDSKNGIGEAALCLDTETVIGASFVGACDYAEPAFLSLKHNVVRHKQTHAQAPAHARTHTHTHSGAHALEHRLDL